MSFKSGLIFKLNGTHESEKQVTLSSLKCKCNVSSTLNQVNFKLLQFIFLGNHLQEVRHCLSPTYTLRFFEAADDGCVRETMN